VRIDPKRVDDSRRWRAVPGRRRVVVIEVGLSEETYTHTDNGPTIPGAKPYPILA
jgi:hypothetical protein